LDPRRTRRRHRDDGDTHLQRGLRVVPVRQGVGAGCRRLRPARGAGGVPRSVEGAHGRLPILMTITVRTRRRIATTFRTVVAVLAVLIVLFPLYWMVQTAILPTELVLSRNPSLVAVGQPASLDAIVHVLTQTPMLRWMGNSLFVTLG